MKKIRTSIKVINLIALLTSGQLYALTLNSTEQALVSIDAPFYKVEQKALHFSQAINSNNALSFGAKAYTTTSDEYWLEVSGKQLNSGIRLDVSHPGALIRLSGKKSNDISAVESIAIDPQQIELLKGTKTLDSAFSQKVSKQQFSSANIFPNSSAVKLQEHIGRGQFSLKVTQPLNYNEKYLVNVKEKGSEYGLTLSVPTQSLLAKQALTFDMAMHNSKGQLTLNANKAFIKTPSGVTLPVKTKLVQGKQSVELPDILVTNSRGELYELHVNSQVHDKGLIIRRSSKVAFAIAQPTAKMTGKVDVEATHAKVELNVASEGRYEISAIVSGINLKGKPEAVMLSRSAYYLRPGEQSANLMFDEGLLKNLNVLPPYSLSQLRLVDQSRMALLQQ
ncbi:DUF4785 domain-containing protein [Cognaticolwellia mytili]|uniref:DUF4785 domain-containing protein n=1 Tax=Cognaticolwellia mytili TaxID=1888913 RepID=UPI000A176FFF|nr:DUF4785 domain-containing protein [Cognaticolwellia mytili]